MGAGGEGGANGKDVARIEWPAHACPLEDGGMGFLRSRQVVSPRVAEKRPYRFVLGVCAGIALSCGCSHTVPRTGRGNRAAALPVTSAATVASADRSPGALPDAVKFTDIT